MNFNVLLPKYILILNIKYEHRKRSNIQQNLIIVLGKQIFFSARKSVILIKYFIFRDSPN